MGAGTRRRSGAKLEGTRCLTGALRPNLLSAGGRSRPPEPVVRIVRGYLMMAGAVSTLVFLWLASPLPLGIDAPLIQNDPPVRSAAIVCLDSGTDHGLPSSSGWQRIRTSVLLFRNGYAPVVIFSGTSGTNPRNGAQIYAEAAGWIGLPPAAARLEPRSRNTLEQAKWLTETAEVPTFTKSSPLLLVSSPYHALRVRLVFRKAGFTRIRIVTSYGPVDAENGSGQWASEFIVRGINRSSQAMVAVREWAALVYYRMRGWI